MKRLSKEEIAYRYEISSEKTGYKYTYTGLERQNEYITVYCPKHDFTTKQRRQYAMEGRVIECCNKVNKPLTEQDIIKEFEKFIDKDNIIINYPLNGEHTRLTITCPKHNKSRNISLQALRHKKGKYACNMCSHELLNRTHSYDKQTWIKLFNEVHNNVYDYSLIEDSGTHRTMICRKHGLFKQSIYNHCYLKNGCPKCVVVPNISSYEKELISLFEEYGFVKDIDFITNDRSILDRSEIDIYFPKLKVGIEFNGDFWHSDVKKRIHYHQDKKLMALSKGINLIMIYEHEWKNKKELLKERLKNILHISPTIYARNTKLRLITNKEYKKFIELTHIQGWCPCTHKYGLFHNDELVACMTFGRPRFGEGDFELIRYSSKCTVVGGFSKLLMHFIKEKQPTSIISYADLDWSVGNVYEKFGFVKQSITQPSYVWVKGDDVKTRYQCQMKFENVIMKGTGYLKIYKCGSIRYKLTLI